MQFIAAIVLAVTSATAALASPALDMRATPPNIGFGQQLQNTDQANHWVTWYVHRPSRSSCPPYAVDGGIVRFAPPHQRPFSWHTTVSNPR